AGSLISGPADPGTADIVGNVLTFALNTAGNGFGVSAANRLEINGTRLHFTTTGNTNNQAFLLDTAGSLVMDNSSMGPGGRRLLSILVQNGNLTSVVDGTGDVRADNVVVAVTGAGSTIGTSVAAPLEINANTLLTATSAGGNIFIKDVVGDLPLGLINAGAGNVDLTSVGAITDGNGAANNIAAGGAALRAVNGSGSGNSLETAISTPAATQATN